MRSHCAPGRCGRNAINPEKPGYFFDQIHLALEIHAPRRHAPHGGHRSAPTALPHLFEAEPAKKLCLGLGRNLHAQNDLCAIVSQRQFFDLRRVREGVDGRAGHGAARDF